MLGTQEILKITKGRLINNIYIDDIKGIASDSKKIKEGFLFVAIKGNKFDGHNFINEALESGAKAIVIQDQGSRIENSEKVPFIVVSNTRSAIANLAIEFYGNPSSKMKVIGVTGTNGKTTVTYLIEEILHRANFATGVIGTINYRFKHKVFNGVNTTPGPLQIQSLLADMLKEDIEYCVMEVSSHSLAQDRVEGIKFTDAIFTNFTQDHLDYHINIRDYFLAKAKLFLGLGQSSRAIINLDDKMGRRLLKLTKANAITYGIDSNADIKATDIKLSMEGAEFVVYNNKEGFAIKTGLIGKHNIYNILASIACCISEKIDGGIIKSAIENFSFVPGRLEQIETDLPFRIFIDYAHTEDALSWRR